MVVVADAAVVEEQVRPELHPLAIAVGEAWATELVRSLRADDREIIGSWPGTLREAHMRVRIALRSKLELAVIDELARVAYTTARDSWRELSTPDLEA
jgi:hypothetical protein